MRAVLPRLVFLALFLWPSVAPAAPGPSGVLLFANEGNRLRRFDVDTLATPGQLEDVFIPNAAAGGRDVNGMICRLPDGSGRYVMGEDSGQPNPPPGWGVFSPAGAQVGKLTATYQVGGAEPFGCATTPEGLLFTTEVGGQSIGETTGQLILWFPPYDVFPGPPGAYPATNAASANFCKLATDIGTAGGVAIDDLGRVYVASSSSFQVLRFSPPFPTGSDAAHGCGLVDSTGAPLATSVNREVFLPFAGLNTYTGIANAPNGNLYIAEVLGGEIGEYDQDGALVRMILDPPDPVPPHATGTPQGIAVGPDGTLYYADLNLVGTFPNLSPGPNGKVWRVRFDGLGNPLAPEIVRQNLAFPDGVAVHPGNLEPLTEWPTYAGSEARLFFNPGESIVTSANAHLLQQRWSFTADAIITGSPAVASVDLPGEGPTQVVYILSWDRNVYAVRLREGTELWRFTTALQPGAAFPHAASVSVGHANGDRAIFIGSGEIFYALDAATGAELWHFTAGTGCTDGMGQPPGLCGFAGERNQIESSALFANGQVYFGMDVNDVGTGKGGFYALDADTGSLAWFFDLETGSTCRPDPGDDIRGFDGYHSEAELGLPAGFLATRSGCSFDRTATGCANVWSSPAADLGRGLLYFASSNCDTDTNPGTPEPPPPMPPWDEAIVALGLDGTPAWRWRPREVDNDDLAFGATPNLFTIDFGGAPRDVLGIGNKDGTYYVLDRDGVNEVSGVAWNDPDPSALPYWTRNVVPGGDIGGIVGTAAVDTAAGRIYFSTAPGDGAANGPPLDPQRPTMHALDMHSGAILWDNASDLTSYASFGPTSGIPGVVFAGQVPGALLRAFHTATGALLGSTNLTNFALASAPAVVDGIVVVGQGIGTITASGSSSSDITARVDSELVALCVPGTAGCAVCGDGALDAGEECDDGNLADDDACWSDCETSDQLLLTGRARGGALRVIVDGVLIEVATSAGASAASVIAQLAAAIEANAALQGAGVAHLSAANRLRTNAALTALAVGDPGLAAGPPLPALPLAGLGLAAGGLLGLALRRLRPARSR